MPKALERKLKLKARKKGFKSERANAYVYGTLRKTGWKPSREKKSVHNPVVSPCLMGVGEAMKETFYKKGLK